MLVTVLDRTATVLDDAGRTVDDVASTLDAADPMLDRVASSLTTTVDSLRGLQEPAAAVSILGAQPLGGLANRFGQVADCARRARRGARHVRQGPLPPTPTTLRTNGESLARWRPSCTRSTTSSPAG